MQTFPPFPVDDRYKSDFPDIASCSRADFHDTLERLLSDRQFLSLLSAFGPTDELTAAFRACDSLDIFQQRFILGLLVPRLEAQTITRIHFEGTENIDPGRGALFISNHRDIIMDATLTGSELYRHLGKPTENAIGNNLLAFPWIREFTRLCKCFTVVRDAKSPRAAYEASCHLSRYIRRAVTEGTEFVWLAQREGRAKDSDDRTQTGILKMLNLSGSGHPLDDIAALNPTALTISYEYDPCDAFKARELFCRHRDGHYTKAPGEDVMSMKTGIQGFKGEVCCRFGKPLAEDLAQIDRSLPLNLQYKALAEAIDRSIHRNYRLWATHYSAAALLRELDTDNQSGMQDLPEEALAGSCTQADRSAFEAYMDRQLHTENEKLSETDLCLLRKFFLLIYANPVRNHWLVTR